MKPALLIPRLLMLCLFTTLSIGQDSTPPSGGRVRVGPEIIRDPFSLGVGTWIADQTFEDLSGASGRLSDYRERPALVVAIRDTECPLSRRYAPRLAELEKELGAAKVPFLYLNVSEHNSTDKMKFEVKQHGFRGRYTFNLAMGRALRAKSTTEVFVLDAARTIRYRGAIDDQYGIGYALSSPRHHYLRDAVRRLLDGKTINPSGTTAPGCALSLAPGAVRPSDVTYHNRISRLFQRSCDGCHRKGASSPELHTYEQIKGTRAMIRQVVVDQTMPPWFADPNTGSWEQPYPFTDGDRADLLAWIDAGAPLGKKEDAPLPKTWPKRGEWKLGKPDLIVDAGRPFPVPAEGTVDYQYSFGRSPLEKDQWIQAMEIRPSNPDVVHHILVFVEEPRRRGETQKEYDERFRGGLRGYFAHFVPGHEVTILEPGSAKLLPAKSWLKFQIHYQPNGVASENSTEIALQFAPGPPRRAIRTASAWDTNFVIPAGAANHEVSATYRFDEQAKIIAFAPHMHLRGKAFRYELIRPNGTTERLLDLPRYDFNWQLRYVAREPVTIPAGSQVRATGWFDNSPRNPANPDPDRDIGFGLQTRDEMMIGYFDWYRDVD